MGPIETMVQDIMRKKLEEDFPQVLLPAVMLARITKAALLPDTFNFDVGIEDMSAGRTFDAKATGKCFMYNLKILTINGDIDTRFPEIPNIKSKIQINPGGTAVVTLLYGGLRPYIIGEAE